MVEEESDASKEIADCRAGFSGTLRVSLSPSMSVWFVSRYLCKFSKQYPDVNYELYECTMTEQAEQLLSGKTEFGVTNGGALMQSYHSRRCTAAANASWPSIKKTVSFCTITIPT